MTFTLSTGSITDIDVTLQEDYFSTPQGILNVFLCTIDDERYYSKFFTEYAKKIFS